MKKKIKNLSKVYKNKKVLVSVGKKGSPNIIEFVVNEQMNTKDSEHFIDMNWTRKNNKKITRQETIINKDLEGWVNYFINMENRFVIEDGKV